MSRLKPFVNLALRVNPIELEKIDHISSVLNENRSMVVRRLLEAGLQDERFAAIIAERDAPKPVAPPAPDPAEQERLERRRKRAAAYKTLRAYDAPNAIGFKHRPIPDEAPHLNLTYGAERGVGWRPDQIALIHQGIMPWEPEWTATPAKVTSDDRWMPKLGYSRETYPQSAEAFIELWRAKRAELGYDPLDPAFDPPV